VDVALLVEPAEEIIGCRPELFGVPLVLMCHLTLA